MEPEMVRFIDLEGGELFFKMVRGVRTLCAKLPWPVGVFGRMNHAYIVGLEGDAFLHCQDLEEVEAVSSWVYYVDIISAAQARRQNEKLLRAVEAIDPFGARSPHGTLAKEHA